MLHFVGVLVMCPPAAEGLVCGKVKHSVGQTHKQPRPQPSPQPGEPIMLHNALEGGDDGEVLWGSLILRGCGDVHGLDAL